jgi:serine/threonine protein kinase
VGRLGDYHLLRKIGQGGMGEIFLAKRTRMGGFEKAFAVKRMLDSLAGSPEFVAMFFDEARLAARLCHPNIAQIYDFGVVDGRYYLAMEHIAGEDLSAVILRLKDLELAVPIGIALRIAIDVCAGLDYAHTLTDEDRPLDIIHRDVSPANIMISYQGVVKLLDFGIAKATSGVSQTRAGSLKGKLSFVAPEQIAGLPADPRADLFSLGIGLYALLTGRHPFRRPTELATMHAITQVDAPDPRPFRPDLPGEVVTILLRALARERAERYASAAEMAAALKIALGNLAPGTGSVELGVWLIGLFGRPRMEQKTRMPTVSQIAVACPITTQLTNPRPGIGSGSSPAHAPAETPRQQRRSRWRTLASTALALALGTLMVVLAGRRGLDPPLPPSSPVRPAAAPSMVRSTPSTANPPTAPGPATTPLAVQAPASRPSTRTRPGPLAIGTLQAVLKRSQHRFTTCFRGHARDLPGGSGQVRIELAVAKSGRVSAARATLPGIVAPSLATCLEKEARRIRFPRHSEKEVRFALPLAYRRGE